MILPASYQSGFAPRDGRPLYPSLWNGCVGAWAPCLGPTGLTLRDWSGLGNHGTLTNMDPGTDWIPDIGRYSLDFDASNDRLRAGIVASSVDLTLSIWHNIASTGTAMLINQTPTNSIWNLFYFSGALTLRGGGTTSVTYTPSAVTSRWVNIAATIKGTVGTLFIDGSQVATGTVNAIGASPTGLDIGAYSDFGAGYFISGKLDCIQIYRTALPPAAIALLARRRGIAYELAPRRRSSSAVQFNRRRRLLLGAQS